MQANGKEADFWVRFLGAYDGNVIVWLSLGGALALIVLRYFTLPNRSLSRPLGAINLSFAESWASVLTAVGALLGTIAGTSGIVAADAKPLSSSALTGLSLLFGFVVVVAPLVYTALSRVVSPRADDTGPAYQGYAATFLAASGVTLWAVGGELLTVAVLLGEIQTGTLSTALSGLFICLVVVSLLLVAIYAWFTLRATIEWDPLPNVRGIDALRTGRPRVNLL